MISILLGSGFSIPEGVKSVTQLNERLNKIDADDIYVHTDKNAFFIEDQETQNKIIGLPERQFVESFLNFYNEEILGDDNFHYEDFYDFYNAFLREEKNADQINEFCDRFNAGLPGDYGKRDPHNRINDFNITFNQLVGSLLENPTYYKDVGLGNYPPYDNFIGFLRKMTQDNQVKVHSLNHDLFFDHIASKVSGLWEHYSDGFELQGSRIYGSLRREFKNKGVRIPKDYRVKLKRFTGDFSGKIALYKLHGSIDNYIAYNLDSDIRIKRDYGVSEFFIEHLPNGKEKYKMSRIHDSIYPDFLSGSTEKIYRYDNAYYKILFDHFKENLNNSDSLLVIGYGFQDEGINKILKHHYLSENKNMIVIDISEPDTDLIEDENCNLIAKSITEVTSEEIENLM
jgi:hypothetical protein